MTDNTFVADDAGPPKRRFWICRDGPSGPPKAVRGWSFIYDEATTDGDWRVGWDTWENGSLKYCATHPSTPQAR